MKTKIPITTAIQIGEVIRRERKRQGILQRDLADLSGVSYHFLSNLENGKATSELQKVLKVLHSLGISVILEPRSGDGGRIDSPIQESG